MSPCPPRERVPAHGAVLPQDGSAQIEQHIVQALLFRPLGGQLQDLRVPAEKLAGVAGGSRRLHLVSCEDPHLHACLVQGLDGVGCFVLQPEKKETKMKELTRLYCIRVIFQTTQHEGLLVFKLSV